LKAEISAQGAPEMLDRRGSDETDGLAEGWEMGLNDL
jgi:hypothetical protein